MMRAVFSRVAAPRSHLHLRIHQLPQSSNVAKSPCTSITVHVRNTHYNHSAKQQNLSAPEDEFEHFYRYTSGRWIWDEDSQLSARYRAFNVPQLKRLAAERLGATTCTSITKLGEGSFNKAFRLVMDNGRVAIARIPYPNAGLEYHSTASEVATMDFARTMLEIPIPEVFAWSGTVDNPVRSPYILMAEAAGTQAAYVWEDLGLEDKVEVLKDLIKIETKLLSVSFSRFGSLYYRTDNIEGSVPAEITGDVSVRLQELVSERFAIGPLAKREFWKGERVTMNVDRGPWVKPEQYLSAIARKEIAWLGEHASPRKVDDPLFESTAQNSPQEHISLLSKYLNVISHIIPSDTDVLSSHIWHRDLHSGNIFIENNRIADIIDWTEVWAGPLFIQARHARLIDYNGEIVLRLPDDYSHYDKEKKAKVRDQVASSIVLHFYEHSTAKRNPCLSRVFQSRHGKTRRDLIAFAGDTWEDDILPFRECLKRVIQYWNDMNIDVPCPITFTDDELKQHYEDCEGWNEFQDFWDSVSGIVNRDGWTSHETYDDAVALFAEIRAQGLKNMAGKERERFDRDTKWAKDFQTRD